MQDAEEEVLEEKPKSLILHLVKQLTAGQDLTRVLIPTFFLEPRSLLEKFSDLMAHPQLILPVSKEPDAMKRMLAVLRWYVSGWHIRPKACKKPYNPLLGEEFFCYWDHPDGSRSLYCAEQVSHHPPVSAVYVENRPNNITLNAQIWTKSKFLGNSAASINVGECNLHVCNLGETYAMDFPTAYACGLFLGTLRMELGGKQTIKCNQTGLVCEIEFITKPMFGGDYNVVKGSVKDVSGKVYYTFEGKWDSVITLKNEKTGAKEALFNVEETPIVKKFVSALEDQNDWESRKVWHQVTLALKSNPPNHDLATKHKTDLEDAQRRRKKEREDKSIAYLAKHFVLQNEKWVFRRLNTKPYDPNEEAHSFDDIKIAKPMIDDDSGLPPGADVIVDGVHHVTADLADASLDDSELEAKATKSGHATTDSSAPSSQPSSAHAGSRQQPRASVNEPASQPDPKAKDVPKVGNILDI